MTTEIVVPTPEAVIPGFADLPDEIQAVIEDLSKPFPVHEVKVRPGSVRRDGSAALCLAYADWWTGYLPRLNDAIGPNNWRISLQPWGENQIIARLSAFGGLIKKESSGSAKGEANGAQEAEVQAKKRVCAEGLMLGLFFYFLPKVWGKGERLGKDFYFAPGEEERCVYEMYRRAGLDVVRSPGITIPRDAPHTRASAPRPGATNSARSAAAVPTPPVNERAAAAAAVLAQAERRAGVAPAKAGAAVGKRADDGNKPAVELASDKQLGLIARLINELRESCDERDAEAAANAIDAVGARFTISGLSELRGRAALHDKATRLTKLQAVKLIDQLKALQTAPAARVI